MQNPIRAALATAAMLSGVLGLAAEADTITTDASYDRWLYPFNASPGIRGTASTFGALDPGPFDNRDGQMHVAYDTAAAGATPGLGAESYEIVSATVTVTHSTGSFVYDDSYDSYLTYDGTLPDDDPGRPVELHGLGFRPPFASLELSPGIPGPPGFEETDAFAFADPTLPGVRNVYAATALGVDVSNNVVDGFESDPWAIGRVAGLTPGAAVPEGTPGVSAGATFSFELDLSDPDVVDYLQAGLDAGVLGFAITSLHEASQEGGTTPNFYTRDNFDPAAIAPSLVLEFNFVPEPAVSLLAASGLLGLAVLSRRRRA